MRKATSRDADWEKDFEEEKEEDGRLFLPSGGTVQFMMADGSCRNLVSVY